MANEQNLTHRWDSESAKEAKKKSDEAKRNKKSRRQMLNEAFEAVAALKPNIPKRFQAQFEQMTGDPNDINMNVMAVWMLYQRLIKGDLDAWEIFLKAMDDGKDKGVTVSGLDAGVKIVIEGAAADKGDDACDDG